MTAQKILNSRARARAIAELPVWGETVTDRQEALCAARDRISLGKCTHIFMSADKAPVEYIRSDKIGSEYRRYKVPSNSDILNRVFGFTPVRTIEEIREEKKISTKKSVQYSIDCKAINYLVEYCLDGEMVDMAEITVYHKDQIIKYAMEYAEENGIEYDQINKVET